MGLGLLGALQGVGKGMSQFGNALFTEEMEKQRRKELEKIRDSDYRRGRADQLTDQKTVRSYQLADQQTGFDRDDTVIDERNTREDANYTRDRADALTDDVRRRTEQLADVSEARGWQKEDRENLFVDYQIDDTGSIIGLTAVGGSKEVGKLANMNPILGEALDAYQYTIRQIDMIGATREDDPDLFNSLDTYSNIMNAGFASSAENMGMNISQPMPTEEAVDLGRLLFNGQDEVNDNGTIRSGQELEDARLNFKRMYPSLFDLFQLPK